MVCAVHFIYSTQLCEYITITMSLAKQKYGRYMLDEILDAVAVYIDIDTPTMYVSYIMSHIYIVHPLLFVFTKDHESIISNSLDRSIYRDKLTMQWCICWWNICTAPSNCAENTKILILTTITTDKREKHKCHMSKHLHCADMAKYLSRNPWSD